MHLFASSWQWERLPVVSPRPCRFGYQQGQDRPRCRSDRWVPSRFHQGGRFQPFWGAALLRNLHPVRTFSRILWVRRGAAPIALVEDWGQTASALKVQQSKEGTGLGRGQYEVQQSNTRKAEASMDGHVDLGHLLVSQPACPTYESRLINRQDLFTLDDAFLWQTALRRGNPDMKGIRLRRDPSTNRCNNRGRAVLVAYIVLDDQCRA